MSRNVKSAENSNKKLYNTDINIYQKLIESIIQYNKPDRYLFYQIQILKRYKESLKI